MFAKIDEHLCEIAGAACEIDERVCKIADVLYEITWQVNEIDEGICEIASVARNFDRRHNEIASDPSNLASDSSDLASDARETASATNETAPGVRETAARRLGTAAAIQVSTRPTPLYSGLAGTHDAATRRPPRPTRCSAGANCGRRDAVTLGSSVGSSAAGPDTRPPTASHQS
jgi:hypothetical protein